MKLSYSLIFVLVFPFVLGCGATSQALNPEVQTEMDLPIYTYLDNKGNQFVITQNKLEYTPISEENTVDGIEDQGYYTLLKLTRNEYNKIAALCEQVLNRSQQPLPEREADLPIPRLIKQDEDDPAEINIDLQAVKELNFILEPFLEDENP